MEKVYKGGILSAQDNSGEIRKNKKSEKVELEKKAKALQVPNVVAS